MRPPTANFSQSHPYLVVSLLHIIEPYLKISAPPVSFLTVRSSLSLSTVDHSCRFHGTCRLHSIKHPFLTLASGVPKLEAAVTFPSSLFSPCRYLSSSVSLAHSLCIVIFLRKSTTSVLGTLKLGDHGALCFLHMFVCTLDGCNLLVQFSSVINFFLFCFCIALNGSMLIYVWGLD